MTGVSLFPFLLTFFGVGLIPAIAFAQYEPGVDEQLKNVYADPKLGLRVSYPLNWIPNNSSEILRPHVLFTIPDEKDFVVITSSDSNLEDTIKNIKQHNSKTRGPITYGPDTFDGKKGYGFINESSKSKELYIVMEISKMVYVFALVDYPPINGYFMGTLLDMIRSAETTGDGSQISPSACIPPISACTTE